MLDAILFAAGAIIVALTLLPVWRTTKWWVRLWDFPRFHIAVAAAGLLVVMALRWPGMRVADATLMSAVAAAALWQLSWIWRYLPLAPREVGSVTADRGSPDCIRLLTANVCQPVRDATALLEIIQAAEPDVVLAVETDEWWCSRLADGLGGRYPHRLQHPLSNGYGLALFSRCELVEPSVRFLIDEAIPSIKTGVRLRNGAVIDLYGLHPRPPALQQDSTVRDLELIVVGREVKQNSRPSIVLGDLNDVAWSATTVKFKEAGGLLDPRRGRGFYNTYPAGLPGLRYPLDYIFHTPHFALCDMRVLPRFASDHLPLVATLGLVDRTAARKDGLSLL